MSNFSDNQDLPQREEIDSVDNLELLMEWHEDVLDLFDSIKAQLQAYKMTGRDDEEHESWTIRAGAKAAYAGTTLRRIERRIVRLGGPLPLTVDREEREQIGKLKYRIRALEHLLNKNGIDTRVNHEGAL